MGYLLTKNRRRLIAGVRTTPATGRAGCEMAKMTMMPATRTPGSARHGQGWIGAAAGPRKTRHHGLARVGRMVTLTAAACNRVRLPKQVANAA